MAHELDQAADGTAAFAAARAPGWHKLGTTFPDRQGLTAAEALEAAHLDWQVELAPVAALHPAAGAIPADRYRATVRVSPWTGEREVLGVVGTGYRPLQNRDAFAFLDNLRDESGATVDTAGALRGGRTVFICQRFPEAMVLDAGGAADEVELYLLASNSHDGSSSFRVAVTPVRVVCANTEQAALRRANRTASLQHRSGLAGQVQEAREALGLTWEYVEEFQAAAEALVREPMSDEEWQDFLCAHLVPEPEEEAPQVVHSRVADRREEMDALWNGPTQENIRGTRWAAWNVWTEWLDHYRPTRDDDGLKRAEDVVDGAKQAEKGRALRELLPA